MNMTLLPTIFNDFLLVRPVEKKCVKKKVLLLLDLLLNHKNIFFDLQNAELLFNFGDSPFKFPPRVSPFYISFNLLRRISMPNC